MIRDSAGHCARGGTLQTSDWLAKWIKQRERGSERISGSNCHRSDTSGAQDGSYGACTLVPRNTARFAAALSLTSSYLPGHEGAVCTPHPVTLAVPAHRRCRLLSYPCRATKACLLKVHGMGQRPLPCPTICLAGRRPPKRPSVQPVPWTRLQPLPSPPVLCRRVAPECGHSRPESA